MSRLNPSDQDVQELTVWCEHCGSEVGKWCTTRNGQWAEYLHNIRWATWADSPQGIAWRRGE